MNKTTRDIEIKTLKIMTKRNILKAARGKKDTITYNEQRIITDFSETMQTSRCGEIFLKYWILKITLKESNTYRDGEKINGSLGLRTGQIRSMCVAIKG